jgi:hypothetical protein
LDGLACDRCGAALLADAPVRYVAELKVYAAYDPMELTSADLAQDHGAEIARLLEEIERRDARALEDEVARAMRLDLCPACHKAFLAEAGELWRRFGAAPPG